MISLLLINHIDNKKTTNIISHVLVIRYNFLLLISFAFLLLEKCLFLCVIRIENTTNKKKTTYNRISYFIESVVACESRPRRVYFVFCFILHSVCYCFLYVILIMHTYNLSFNDSNPLFCCCFTASYMHYAFIFVEFNTITTLIYK